MKYYSNILKLIGRTPLVRIDKSNPNPNVLLLAKLEKYNPAGSVKDRIAKSMIEEAIEELEKAVELSGRIPMQVIMLAITYYEIGKKVEAEKLFESLEERSRDEYVPPICFFYIHLIRGEKNKALEWLERACKEHDGWLSWMRIIPIDLFRIPDEQEYQDLLKKYGLGK